MESFIDKYNILTSDQYGFRKGGSTTNAIFDLINLISTNKDKNKITVTIFLDFQKAFDTIDHDILMKKLYCMGFRGKIYNMIKSYLSNRQIYTKVCNTLSHQLILENGIPQGSILGPLLFILYINDLSKNIPCKLRLFADDTVLIISSKCINKIQVKINQVMNALQNWMHINKLYLNLNKTCAIYFSPLSRNKPQQDKPVIYFITK